MQQKKKTTIAVLGAGLLQQPLIAEAGKAGLTTIVLDQNNEAYARHDAGIFLNVQIADARAVIAALEPYRDQLAFACTVATDFSHIVAAVNEAFSLPGLNTAQGAVLTHKGKMRDFCRQHGHAHPRYICATTKEDCEIWAAANPCADGYVIKPVQNMGARGVMYLKEASELAFGFEFAQAHGGARVRAGTEAIDARSQAHGGAGFGEAMDGGSRKAHGGAIAEVILEHYIPAREISVDALCFEGQVFLTGVADRLIEIKDAHFFIENGHNLPGNFSAEEYEAIRQAMQAYADSLASLDTKPYHGALKGDLRLTADGRIVIGEIAGRLSGGFMSTHTYAAAHGRNLMQMFLTLMQHDRSVILSHADAVRTSGIATERSIYAEPGEISGLPSAKELASLAEKFRPQGLVATFCNYQNGDLVTTLQNNVGKVLHTVFFTPTLSAAETAFAAWRAAIDLKTQPPEYDGRAMAKSAREKFNNDFCWVCKVCDGGYCASGVPGMGGRGEMNSFRDNINALQEFRITPQYTTATTGEADTRSELFAGSGVFLEAPLLSAPITGSVTNMGGSITEFDYAIETGTAMTRLGLMPTFGDGASADKYRVGLHAIGLLGRGIPVFKPRTDQSELIRRIREAEAAGAIAWGIDIDGVSFKTMVNKNAATSHKSLQDLKSLAAASRLPFVVKGVMTERDAATAIEAGAAAIVVSNHGGRVLDGMPGTARVLPQIAAFAKREAGSRVRVLADGGIRSGADIFRMLALGADAVLIGRPIAIMAVGLGRSGVMSLLEYYIRELKQTMRVTGCKTLADISARHITKFI